VNDSKLSSHGKNGSLGGSVYQGRTEPNEISDRGPQEEGTKREKKRTSDLGSSSSEKSNEGSSVDNGSTSVKSLGSVGGVVPHWKREGRGGDGELSARLSAFVRFRQIRR